jgi:hypothetical protein
LNFPPGTPSDEILELTLQDFILEMEEKIHVGGLGSLKVYTCNIFVICDPSEEFLLAQK